jgi:hypothetical protein
MSDYFEVGQEFLEHYGVLGMKWGVRRDRVSNPTLKGDLARASLGGPKFAPESSGRLAKRAVKSAKAAKKTTGKADIARASLGGPILAPKSTGRVAKRAFNSPKGKATRTKGKKAVTALLRRRT